MSLEQALSDLTAAIKTFTSVVSSGALATAPAAPVPAPAPAKAKPETKPEAKPEVKPETKPEAKPAALDYEKDVVPALKAVAADKNPGRGRDGLISLLKRYLPGDDKPDATKLKPLGDKFEAIIADAKALVATGTLPDTAGPAADDLGL